MIDGPRNMLQRNPIGYVIGVSGIETTLNLLDQHRGMVASHFQGVSTVTEIGSFLGIDSGHELIVIKVLSVNFAEPKEIHRHKDILVSKEEPLRNLKGVVVGIISKENEELAFESGSLRTPALGAFVYPLIANELKQLLVAPENDDNGKLIHIGDELRSDNPVKVSVQDLISRHVAVLGSTGQGKSCFTAAVLQQIIKLENSKTVVFDINGEYRKAFEDQENLVEITTIGKDDGDYKIPYYALGRYGLQRILLPSEKTQLPALNFALKSLHRVCWINDGVGLSGNNCPMLFDDCREGDATNAYLTVQKLRNVTEPASKWPPMNALAPLIAESYSLKQNNSRRWVRDPYMFGHISPLINRIHRLLDDPLFTDVINVVGGASIEKDSCLQKEAEGLVTKFFGDRSSKWRVHIVELHKVAHDLLPLILSAILEQFSYKTFRQSEKVPRLLVLEEAHHYLRQINSKDDNLGSTLAYERVAKEGRKFGVALWISTQRPSEISPTVLSQCNNWISFKLNSQKDIDAIHAASEWSNKQEVKGISGLKRQHALAFGGGLRMPLILKAPKADPLPDSKDGEFKNWVSSSEAN